MDRQAIPTTAKDIRTLEKEYYNMVKTIGAIVEEERREIIVLALLKELHDEGVIEMTKAFALSLGEEGQVKNLNDLESLTKVSFCKLEPPNLLASPSQPMST